MNKNKKFKFTVLELLIIIASFFVLGILAIILVDKINKGESFIDTAFYLIGIFLSAGTIIFRNKIKIVEIKTEI